MTVPMGLPVSVLVRFPLLQAVDDLNPVEGFASIRPGGLRAPTPLSRENVFSLYRPVSEQCLIIISTMYPLGPNLPH